MNEHAKEVADSSRFEFGANWRRFLAEIDEERIAYAKRSLQTMLDAPDLAGKSFLDAGSGSGLFSLAARELGARVHSFDYDPQSVACTIEVKSTRRPADPAWTIEEASVLDDAYMSSLGGFDIVYSWGVLHHTGAMWQALANVAGRVREGGTLFIALYNDQGRASKMWLRVKRAYNWLPRPLRWLVLLPAFVRLWGPTTVRDILLGRPFHTWRQYGKAGARGMSPWRDVVDWVGGLPFEVAKPEAVFDFLRARHFRLEKLVTCAGGHGCNEYVFKREE